MIEGDDGSELFVPHKRWYAKQREAVGAEAWLWAMVQIAQAEHVLQHGSDEMGIDRQGTFAQWFLLESCGVTGIITLEAGGVLVGGTAEEVAAHIKETWRRGVEAISILRDDLGDDADRLLLIRKGGFKLLKILSTMGDTCNTQRLVQERISEMKEESGLGYYGEEAFLKGLTLFWLRLYTSSQARVKVQRERLLSCFAIYSRLT